MPQDSGSGDPSKGDVGATGQLDATVIHKDGSRENVTPKPILQQAWESITNLFK
ncbi:MAG: hypothetical protein KGL39_29210 [Patescibacteria group bacterium]|nr:hypothetical protein [Patescibacteria group bacterium]